MNAPSCTCHKYGLLEEVLQLLVMDFQAKFICCSGSGSVPSLLGMDLSSVQVPFMPPHLLYIITRGREKTWMLMMFFPRWRRKAVQQSSSTQQCHQHCNPLGTGVLLPTAVPPSAQTTLNTDGTKLGDLSCLPEMGPS